MRRCLVTKANRPPIESMLKQCVMARSLNRYMKHNDQITPDAAISILKYALELEAENKKLKEALKWYAQGAPIIGYDRGERAREALKELEG